MAATTQAATLNTPISKLRSAPMDRILAVEDDGALQKILKGLFPSEGHEVDAAADGEAGLEKLVTPGLPLVIVSASYKLADKVLLLEMGDDDCVAIPFSPAELVARLGALVRRASRVCSEDIYVFDDVMVDFSETEITRRGEKIVVTAKEFKTLAFLIKNAKRVVSRDELLNEVWGYQNYPCTRTVDNHILRLRQKLERDPSRPLHLLTVHCLGYKFMP
ncbi:MAG: response regulator transcription factor [Terriglobales bacterium]|jgi:DNA-binding response OmpR family regulator